MNHVCTAFCVWLELIDYLQTARNLERKFLKPQSTPQPLLMESRMY